MQMIAEWMVDVEFLGAIAPFLYSAPFHRRTPVQYRLPRHPDVVAMMMIGAEDWQTAVSYGMPR
jgi:hypothetical protein